jgi:large subunit ribosomal protein L4
MLKSLSLADKKTLVVLPSINDNVVRSGRNIQNTKIITASQLNTFDVMNAQQLVLVESSLDTINNLLK